MSVGSSDGKNSSGKHSNTKKSSSQPSACDPSNWQKWESRYQSDKTGWDRGSAHPAINDFLKGELEAPCRILVPGCGRGHEVLLLCAKGFEVTAVDFAPFPIQHLQTEVTRKGMKAEIIQLDILEAKFETPFDAIYEQTCLCALEPSNWTQYERQIRSFLKPGGKLFALFMQTTEAGGPPFHCDISEMRELFSEAHWIWPTETGKKYPHPAGIYEYAVVLEKKVTP